MVELGISPDDGIVVSLQPFVHFSVGPKLIFTFYCWDCCNHVFEHHNPLVRPYFLWVATILNIISPPLLKASLIFSAIHFWFIQQGS